MKKERKIKFRNWIQVDAWSRKAGPEEEKKKILPRKRKHKKKEEDT